MQLNKNITIEVSGILPNLSFYTNPNLPHRPETTLHFFKVLVYTSLRMTLFDKKGHKPQNFFLKIYYSEIYLILNTLIVIIYINIHISIANKFSTKQNPYSKSRFIASNNF